VGGVPGRVGSRRFLGRAEPSRELLSSSLLPITGRHVEASPDATYVGTEKVEVRTLDSYAFDGRIYLKIDAQGFETPILEGARETLDRAVVGLELELSTTRLYEGQALIGDVLNDLRVRGFSVLSLAPCFVHPETREILQLDGIFTKNSANGGS